MGEFLPTEHNEFRTPHYFIAAKVCTQFGIRCNALLPGLTDISFASALVKNEAILSTALQQI